MLEIQKAEERRRAAQQKVNKLSLAEAAEHKKVVRLAREEEKLREEASEAHAAASSIQVARILAKKKSDKAFAANRKVIAAKAEATSLAEASKVAMQKTLHADSAAKIAQATVETLTTQVDTSLAAQKAVKQASKSAVHGIHKKLAVDIAEKNDAKDSLQNAEGRIEAAKKAQIEAETPARREKAKVALVTAQAAAKHAKTSLQVAETNSDAAVKVAGMKRKNAAISVANARCGDVHQREGSQCDDQVQASLC